MGFVTIVFFRRENFRVFYEISSLRRLLGISIYFMVDSVFMCRIYDNIVTDGMGRRIFA